MRIEVMLAAGEKISQYLCIYVTAKKSNFPERFWKESEYAETPS